VSDGTQQMLLRVSNLTIEYREAESPSGKLEAVRDVSLDIPRGGILALVGESGSGKTSLAHAILQLLPIASGQVLFQGRDLVGLNKAGMRAARRSIQAVFQDPLASLSPRRSIRQTLLEPLDHFAIGTKRGRSDIAAEAIEAVGLEKHLLDRYPHELSGGQRQRVGLARALVCGPDLVVADEPVSSLDVSMQARIVELILELRERLGVAFLFVSHDLSVVRRLADRVAVMYAGQIVESGPASQIFKSPAHPYTRALLRSVPVADPEHEAPIVLEGEPSQPLTPPTGCVFHKRCADALPDCPLHQPVERAISGTEQDHTEHRVRCHLWNS